MKIKTTNLDAKVRMGGQLPKLAQKGKVTATATWSKPSKMGELMRS